MGHGHGEEGIGVTIIYHHLIITTIHGRHHHHRQGHGPGSGWTAGAPADVPKCNQRPQHGLLLCCAAALLLCCSPLPSAALLLACAPECNRQRATGRRGSMRVPARAARVEAGRAGVAQKHRATDMGALTWPVERWTAGLLGCWDVGMLSRAARMGEGRGGSEERVERVERVERPARQLPSCQLPGCKGSGRGSGRPCHACQACQAERREGLALPFGGGAVGSNSGRPAPT
jgi:hypothetical protein